MKQQVAINHPVNERQEVVDFRRSVALAVLEGLRARIEARKTTMVKAVPKRWSQRPVPHRVWDAELETLARAS